MGKKGTGKVLKECLYCQKQFYARRDRLGKYCSKSCGSRIPKVKSYKVIKQCVICSKKYLVRRYRENSTKCCSYKCIKIYRRRRILKKTSLGWEKSLIQKHRPWKVVKLIKSLLKEIKFCMECGSIEDLQGHHVISYADAPHLGDDINNIKILCRRCHANKHPEFKNWILKGKIYD